MKFLPDTFNKRWGYVNLEEYCVHNSWNAYRGVMPISIIHKERSIDCSYGGYLEYRKNMLNNTYLDKDEKYLHLGVDFNIEHGSHISTIRPIQIVLIDNDHPEPHGWGPRVIVRMFHNRSRSDIYLIYAHLDVDSINGKVGDILPSGFSFARVGVTPYNGGWWSHLHVQAMTHKVWKKYENNLADLDGYGRLEDIEELSRDFPDPLPILLGE